MVEEFIQPAPKIEGPLTKEQLQRQTDLIEVLSLPSGRRLFRDLFYAGKIFKSTFKRESDRESIFQQGAQSLALRYLKQIEDLLGDAVLSLVLFEK